MVAVLASRDLGTGSRYALIVLMAIAMGIQNTAARQLAVPDLTTTVPRPSPSRPDSWP